MPEPSDAASSSAFGASREVSTPVEATAAGAASIPAAGAGDGARHLEEDSKDEENAPTRGLDYWDETERNADRVIDCLSD